MEVLANFVTALAYFWITFNILIYAYRSKLLRRFYKSTTMSGKEHLFVMLLLVATLFSAFIFFCGLTHLVAPLSPYGDSIRVILLYVCSLISFLTAIVATFLFPAIIRITDRMELTEEGMLRNVQSHLVDVIESCQESIVVMSANFFILTANASTKKFFGDQYMNVPFLLLIHEDDRTAFTRAVHQICRRHEDSDNPLATPGATGNCQHVHKVDRHETSGGKCSEVSSSGEARQIRVEYRVSDGAEGWTWVESTIMMRETPVAEENISRTHNPWLSSTIPHRVTPQCGTEFFDVESGECTYIPEHFTIVMLSRNVDKIKQEELLKKEREIAKQNENMAKLKYITCCAHDLKTPLQSFEFAINLLAQTPLQSDQVDIIQQARISAQLMSLTISQTMDSSKVLIGERLLPRKKTVALSEVVLRAAVVIESYAREVPITFSLSRNIQNFVITDEEWLWQMILNYLTNACKFTESGSVDVRVELWSEVEDKSKFEATEQLTPISSSISTSGLELTETGDYLLFQIIDSGIGVSETSIATLFNLYSQAQIGQSTGTGMGLYGVKIRSDGLDGSCGVFNRHSIDKKQTGSVFWFKVPYAPDASNYRSANGDKAALGGGIDMLGDDHHFRRPPGLFHDMSWRNGMLCMEIPVLKTESRSSETVITDTSLRVTKTIPDVAGNTCAPPGDSDDNTFSLCSELTAFVVDDVLPIRKLMRRTLQNMGFKRIELFENGSRALAALQEEYVDIVFCDIQMPVMSGPEAVSRLRKFELETCRPRRQLVVAVSANFSNKYELELVSKNLFDAVVPKPIGVSDIQHIVVEYLAQQLPLKFDTE